MTLKRSERRLILIADDERDTRTTFRYHFGDDLGYEVVEAETCEAAFEIVEQNAGELAVVVTDIKMPKMGGKELIRRLQERWPSLPIIGVTGHENLRGKLELLGGGAYYYLDKPFEPWPVMERLVANAIRVYDLEQEMLRRRGKERELARLVRSYILHNASRETDDVEATSLRRSASAEGRGPVAAPGATLALDIKIVSLDTSEPAGDFAEWFERSGSEVIFYVADAAGHSDLVPCILACLSSLIIHRSHHRERPTVERMISVIDRELQELRKREALDPRLYLTFFLGSVDLNSGEMRYVSAAHNDVLFLRQNEHAHAPVVRRLGSSCRPVGSPVGCDVVVAQLTLQPGDLLFLFTDGAYEHLSGKVAELERVVTPLLSETSEVVVREVASYLDDHFRQRGFPDDTTLMALKVMARP